MIWSLVLPAQLFPKVPILVHSCSVVLVGSPVVPMPEALGVDFQIGRFYGGHTRSPGGFQPALELQTID